LCTTLVICLSASVVIRYAFPIFSKASHWAEEIAIFSFIWLLYWGASLATRTGKHFSVTAQFGLFPKRFKKYAVIPGNIVWLIFNLAIMKFGLTLVKFSIEESLSLEIPMNIIYFIIPMSFFFISFRLVQHTIRSLTSTHDKEISDA
jgi:TRAP-type C4-dicarboxylate transport system permease small subunit